MEEAFLALSAGTNFRTRHSDAGRQTSSALSPEIAPRTAPKTNDPLEAASLVRRKHGIRAHGSGVQQPVETFKELRRQYKLPKSLLASLTSLGFKHPTPVQIQVLPLLLSKRDVIAISPTGSGKTLAFLLSVIVGVVRNRKGEEEGARAVLVSPSRELAQQTARVLESLAKDFKLHVTLVTKSSAAGEDFSKVEVLVTTPLRLSRLLKRQKLRLGNVRSLVLDETDKLLELGFQKQIDKIMAACTHPNLVTSMFSATIPETIEQLARSSMKDPVRVTVGDRNAAAVSVQQQLKFVGNEEGKFLLLQQLLQTGLKAPVLIFVSSKEKAVILHRRLMSYNIRVNSIFSSQDYQSRATAMMDFRSGQTWVLISTDVLARGIDFVGVQTVLSFDCPQSTQDYIHRIGRTGRAGQSGQAITFFTEADAPHVRQIANVIAAAGQEVPKWMLDKKRPLAASQKQKGKKQKRQ